eukprot:scaffold89146_cov32-Tisochrysis_lutea.AAC.1
MRLIHALMLVYTAGSAAALSVGPVRAPVEKTLARSLSLPVELDGQMTTLRAEQGQEAAAAAAEFLITHGVTGDDFDILLPALEASIAARGCPNGRLAKLMDEVILREESAVRVNKE